jgi:hypothetical protein
VTCALCLDWLAAFADGNGRPHDAAALFGAADAQWQAGRAVRYAPEQANYTQDVARVRTHLTDDDFAAAWAEGQPRPARGRLTTPSNRREPDR